MISLGREELQQKKSLPQKVISSAYGISRTSLSYTPKQKENRNMDVLEGIHKIVEAFPTYGHRRIKAELKRSFGYIVNHKRLLKIMREEGLISKKRKKKRITTTDSKHGYSVFPNLLAELEITRLDQVWVSDITYIYFRNGVGYLASVLDAHSRRCIGYAFETHMRQDLTIAALERAIKSRKLKPSTSEIDLIHHSDRGSQYAADAYKSLLKKYGIKGSMSGKGNCYDNAIAESFNKTIKYDEVYLNEYEDFYDALSHINHFIKDVYNKKRLHSSIGYLPPIEFESMCALHTVR